MIAEAVVGMDPPFLLSHFCVGDVGTMTVTCSSLNNLVATYILRRLRSALSHSESFVAVINASYFKVSEFLAGSKIKMWWANVFQYERPVADVKFSYHG
jgi:siroheme synthase (precorrin-2 oxidase/ferrochelatase)